MQIAWVLHKAYGTRNPGDGGRYYNILNTHPGGSCAQGSSRTTEERAEPPFVGKADRTTHLPKVTWG